MLYGPVYSRCPENTNLQTERRFVVDWGFGEEWGLAVNGHVRGKH